MQISTVIPRYATPLDRLLRALSSIRVPSGAESEVIVVDDGSPDVGDLTTWLDPSIRLVRLPTNQGIAAATNAGYAVATGDWLQRLSSTDVFLPERTKLIERAIAEGKPAYASGSYCELTKRSRRVSIGHIAHSTVLWGPLLRRDTVLTRYDERFRSSEDYIFANQVHREYGWTIHDKPTIAVTEWPDGLTSTMEPRKRLMDLVLSRCYVNSR